MEGKQQQLNEALEQEAELAAVVFDRWLDAQYQPLRTIASYSPEQLSDQSSLEADLKAALSQRSYWIDLRIVDAGAQTVSRSRNLSRLAVSGLAVVTLMRLR